MRRFRFIHASDLHLDTPFEGIRQVAPQVADALRDASLEAWDALVDLTIEQEAAFLLLAGDIYDGAERGVRSQLRFLRGLERLTQRGIQVFVVHGNHDPLDGWSAIQRFPDGVKVFGTEVDAAPVEHGGERVATVYGISYPTRDVTENLALRFRREPGPGLNIGLLHCNAGNNPEHAPYSPCSLDDLRAARMDYWALGHIHQHQVLDRDPWIVYAGNLQGRSPKHSEQGEKGAVVVEVQGGRVQGVRFVALDRVRYITFSQDVSEAQGLPDVARELRASATKHRAAHPGRGLVLRATLTGRGGPHGDLRRPGAIEELHEDIRGDAEGERPFLWWESIRDETTGALDRDAIRARGDFSAELLNVSQALMSEQGGPGTAAFLAAHDEPLRRAGRRLLPDVDPVNATELLREAEALALELLEEDADA